MRKLKEVLGGVIIATLLILILVTYLICYNLNKNDKEKDDEIDIKYSSVIYILTDNTIKKTDFNSDKLYKDKIKGKYKCNSDSCDIYENDVINPIYDDRYILIKENDKVYIYDFIDDKKSNGYDDILSLLDSYLLVEQNGKQLLLDLAGVEVTALYDKIDFVYNNLVRILNNEMYGIYDIKNNKLLIDTIYSYIDITDNNYFTVKEDDMYYVIDKDNNIVSDKYEYIFAFNKGYIAKIDNKLKIFRYSDGSKLHDMEIDIIDTFDISKDSNMITIVTDKKYLYDVNRNDFK